MNEKLTKRWKNMVDVQPGFYEGVDGYEQAWKPDIIINLMNDTSFNIEVF